MPDRNALLRAVAANHRAWFRRGAAARGGAVEPVGGIELMVEGGGWGNLAFPGARARSSARLDEVMRRARSLRVRRMSCWSLAEDRVLGTLLIARGFEWGWQPHWMALDLRRIPDHEPSHQVVAFEPASPGPRLPYSAPLPDPASVCHLSVRHRAETVGHVVVNPWRGYAGIYNMGVVPRRRRRGIGRALTLAACRAGLELGCSHAILNATPEGELLYRSVGFQSLGQGRTWWLHPGRRPTVRQTALVEAIGLRGVEALAALRPTRVELERPIPGAGAPLSITALTGQPEVADWILGRRPELVRSVFEPGGATLLHLAVEWDSEPLLRVALARGADPGVRDRTFEGTPLGWARHFERPRLAALLS